MVHDGLEGGQSGKGEDLEIYFNRNRKRGDLHSVQYTAARHSPYCSLLTSVGLLKTGGIG